MDIEFGCTLQPGLYVDWYGVERECVIAILYPAREELVFDAESGEEVVAVTYFATGPPE